MSATILIHISKERWRYSISIIETIAITAQLITPQPEPSILNDVDMQADFWREQTEAKAEEIGEIVEKNAELEEAIEELEKEVDRLNDGHSTRSSNYDTNDVNSDLSLEVEATFYTAFCDTGCIGVTATGLDVSSTIYTPDGYRVIAVDPRVIALGSIVKVTLENGDSFEAKASDTGGDIKGNRIDILVKSRDEAYRLGRQSASIEVIE